MKTYSSAITNYRADLKGYFQVNLLCFVVKTRDTGETVRVNFSDREYNETIQIVNQSTGDLEFRDFIAGAIVDIDPLIRSEGTNTRNFNVTLSGVHQSVLDMVQGYDTRDAEIEWHIGEAEEGTELLIDTPVCEFIGIVDTPDLEDSAVDPHSDGGSESHIVISITSYLATLQFNPDMRSLEIGQERSDDDIFQYAAETNQWDILWGKEGKKHKKDHHHKGKDDPSPDHHTWGHR